MVEVVSRLLSIALVAIALAALQGCELLASDESRIAKAVQLHTQGDHRAAAIELKKVLQKNPDNGDARFLLGEISLFIGEAGAAEKELRRAQELGVSKDNVIVLLGQALLEQGELPRALEALDPQAVSSEEARVGIFMLRGEAYLGLGSLDEAESAFREMLRVRPDSLDARIGLAGVEQAKGNVVAAEAYVAEVLTQDAANLQAWLMKGELGLRRGAYAESGESFAQALKLSPRPVQELIARNGLAESQWRQGHSDAALQNVQRMLELSPRHPRPKYFRALIAYGAGDYETAKDYLQQVLNAFPDYQPAAFLLAATHYARGDLEQADMYLSRMLAAVPANVSARKLLAATRLRQRKPQDAIATLSPVLPRDDNDAEMLALMGRASLEAGDADSGILLLQRGARTDPANPSLQIQLAAGYLTTGDLKQAIELLEKIPETKEGAYGREVLLILAYLRAGDSAGALAQADKLVANRPNEAGVYNLAGSAYMAAGRTPRARELLENASRLQPESVAVMLNLGRLDLQEGKQDSARARFERVLAIRPDNINAMLALAQLSALRGDQSAVTQWLERAGASNPEAIQPKLLLVRHYLDTGNIDRARSVVSELIKADPENAEVHNAAGMVHMVGRKPEEAVASFSKAVAAAPWSPNFHYNLARAQITLTRLGDAKKTLGKTLELEPDHVPATSTLAGIEMREGHAAQALARARALQRDQDAATATAGHVLEGDLQMMQREFKRAVSTYDIASKRVQSSALAIRSYQARKQASMSDAAKPLQDWLVNHPDDTRARLTLAQAYEERGEFRQAAAEYERVLKNRPENAAVLNNLAWIYGEMRDARAIQTAERAHALRPESGAVSDTLGWLLVQQGEVQRGLELLRKAAKQAPNAPAIRYHLAVALAKAGAREEARDTLAELINSGQVFKELPKAKQLLQQL